MLGLLLGLRLAAPQIPPPPPEDPFPAAFELTWDAPAGCSSAAAIEARVAALLEGVARGEGVAVVHATVTQAPDGVTMALTTTYAGRSDARTVTSASCASLEEATALLLAIALEPRLAPEPEPEGGEPEGGELEPDDVEPEGPTLERPPAPSVATAPEPDGPRRRSTPLLAGGAPGWTAAVAVGGEWGQIRQPTFGVRVDVGVAQSRWRAEVQGRYFAPRRREAAAAVVLMQAGTAGLRGCWTPSAGEWHLATCGGAEAGALRLDSRELTPPEQRVGPLVGATAAVEVARTVGAAELWLGVDAFVRIWATRVRVQGDDLLVPWPISPRVWLGARFGRR